MKETPKVGIICAGKDSAELANSIYGASYLTKMLREQGYASGGYHTALFAKGDENEKKSATIKLISLCKSNDLVISVGADGFCEKDLMPEISKRICEKSVNFFRARLDGTIIDCDSAKSSITLPSRSYAGITQNCLILNVRSNKDFIYTVFPHLIPHINFALLSLCGKSAPEALCKERELMKNIDL